MSNEEIERADAGKKKNYRIVYRYKTYKDGERELHSCILLPPGHPLFGVAEDAEGLQSHFPLPVINAGHGSRFGVEVADSWWLVFGELERADDGISTLSFDDIKALAIPQIIAALEEGETDPHRFSRPEKESEANA